MALLWEWSLPCALVAFSLACASAESLGTTTLVPSEVILLGPSTLAKWQNLGVGSGWG